MSTGFTIFSQLILPVFAMIAAGYALERRLKLDLSTLTRINLYLCIPSLGFIKIYESTVPVQELGIAAALTLVLALLMVAAGWMTGAAMGLPRSIRAGMAAACSSYNSGNYGLALVELVFHRAAFPVAIQAMVVAVQNLFTFTGGMLLVTGGRRTWKESVRATLQYPFLYLVTAAILLRLSHFRPVPVFLEVAMGHLSDAVVPVALITLGAQVSRIPPGQRLDRAFAASVVRLVGGPALMFGLIRLFALSRVLAATLLISAGVPTSVNITVLSIEYDSEPELVSQITLWTTLLSAISMTAVVYLALLITGTNAP